MKPHKRVTFNLKYTYGIFFFSPSIVLVHNPEESFQLLCALGICWLKWALEIEVRK